MTWEVRWLRRENGVRERKRTSLGPRKTQCPAKRKLRGLITCRTTLSELSSLQHAARGS